MTRDGVTTTEFNIELLKLSQEFIVTRFSSTNQIILGYEFLKEFNPSIDLPAGTSRMPNMEMAQAIVTKRTVDVKHLPGKQMPRLLKKNEI